MCVLLKRLFRGGVLPLIFLAFLAVSCGSGGGGGGSSVSVAGGGIGGTGVASGVITRFGSIYLGTSKYDISRASFSVDQDDTATQEDLAVGMKVVITGDIAHGMAESVVYEPEIKGFVDSVDLDQRLLVVMGQSVMVDGGTQFGGDFAAISDIKPDDVVEISGFFDAEGSLHATYVGLEDSATQTLKVKGTVTNLNSMAKTFDLKDLTVDYHNVTSMVRIHKDDFIEVRGTLDPDGILIADHLEMEMMTPMVQDDEEMELEGIITDVPSANNLYYLLNGMSVEVTGQTSFESGSEENLARNVRIEVKGFVSNGVLVAEEIEIKE